MIPTTSVGSGATAVVLDRPGGRFGPAGWCTLLLAVASVASAAVSIPTLSAVDAVFVPLAFLVGAAHAAALALSARRPAWAIAGSAVAVLATAALTVTSDLPWPLPVATMITQLLLCAFIAIRGRLPEAITALVVSVLAASAPLVLTLGQDDLWGRAAGNLVTFGCIALLVTVLGLALSRFIPWEQDGHAGVGQGRRRDPDRGVTRPGR